MRLPKPLLLLLLFLLSAIDAAAQQPHQTQTLPLGGRAGRQSTLSDSIERTDVPEGLYAWTVHPRFGDIVPTPYDTVPHAFQREAFTSGMTGHYNYTGNLAAPRISRHFLEQTFDTMSEPFLFLRPYDYSITTPGQLLFTNTKSPFTTITYHECGNKQNGEDRIKANFAVNAGKHLGVGFKADYLYGRGYYQAQSTAHFNGSLYGSYITDRYKLHLIVSHLQLKTRENGGIQHDDFVNRPESFPTTYSPADMPINLQRAWNKIMQNTLFFTHRYSLGLTRYRDQHGRLVKKEDALRYFESKRLGSQPDTRSNNTIVSPTDSLSSAGVQSSDSLSHNATPSALPLDSLALQIAATDSLHRQQPAARPVSRARQPRGVDLNREFNRSARSSSSRTAGQPRRQTSSTGQASDSLLVGSEPTADTLTILTEFVPVTSFIHSFRLNDGVRRFQSRERNNIDNPGYFSHFFLPGDSASDRTDHILVENTLALELHEGFNKWMQSGIQLYGRHAYNRYTLPNEQKNPVAYVENYFTIGARLLREQGKVFHYHLLGELRTTGTDWGEVHAEGDASLTLPFRRDSLRIKLTGSFNTERPTFYYRHYHGRNAWWDNDNLKKEIRTSLAASASYHHTRLTASLQNLQNYTYFAEELTPYGHTDGYTAYRHGVKVRQSDTNIQLLGLTLNQDFKWGILHWDNELTYQTTTKKDAFPVPAFTGYSNLYLLFRLAKVLRTEVGGDVTYFTPYYAPTYSPIIGQYAVQDKVGRVKVGNYPIVNVYANFHLKRTRFYIMASHVNYKQGSGRPFLVPHAPLNQMVIRLGLSWNFIN